MILNISFSIFFSRNPTPDNSLGVTWKPYTTEGNEYFNLDDSFCMGTYADKERMEFWDRIYDEAGLQHLKYKNFPYQKKTGETSITILSENLCD